jgi:hypothetical protein
VQINHWPAPGSDHDSETPSTDEEPIDGPDRDPDFEQLPAHPAHAELDPLYEPDMADEQALALMRLRLGDLADEEWLNLCEYLATFF